MREMMERLKKETETREWWKRALYGKKGIYYFERGEYGKEKERDQKEIGVADEEDFERGNRGEIKKKETE